MSTHPSAIRIAIPLLKPAPKPIVKEVGDEEFGIEEKLACAALVELIEEVGVLSAIVAIEKGMPDCDRYAAVAYTEGAGASNKSWVTLQHAVFVRLMRSTWCGISP
jgi:hypothetical protein